MESIQDQKKVERTAALKNWLATVGDQPLKQIVPVAGDASFRRYFRVMTPSGSRIAMDAPPPQENCAPFIAVAGALRALGLNAPEILAADTTSGFLLLTDYGDKTFLRTLTADNADSLYHGALEALSVLQGCKQVQGRVTPPFTVEFMRQEWGWHKEWFLGRLLSISPGSMEKALDDCFEIIVASAAAQPQVFMHRDYHSANLMVLTGEANTPGTARAVGILDFQDAFIGPVTYDLVSLLRDCYIDWPEERVRHWVGQYHQMLQQQGMLVNVDQQQFMRWFDLMGIERHLKALFTFARKQVRDHQPEYLQHVPRTLGYVLSVSQRYPELAALHDFMQTTVLPASKQVII